MKTRTSHITNSMTLSPLRRVLLLVPLMLACFTLSPAARAVDPPSDGGFDDDNTAMSLPFTEEKGDDPGLVTIFSNLASKYPKGIYWCCSGYNVTGPNSSFSEQWMAAAFTPDTDHMVTKIQVAAGWSDGTNGIVISLNEDTNGIPGTALKTWNVSGLPFFGTCCTLLKVSSRIGIPVSGGQQYWVMLSTNDRQLDTVDAWNMSDADQVDEATLASFTSNEWNVFQAVPGVAFAVKGN